VWIFRHLNTLTIKQKYLVPIIDEFLDDLQGASWFSNVIPGSQRREVGGYSFWFFSLFRWLRFGNLEFEEKHSPVGQ
jgi:hypothetical protein